LLEKAKNWLESALEAGFGAREKFPKFGEKLGKISLPPIAAQKLNRELFKNYTGIWCDIFVAGGRKSALFR